LRIRFLRSFLPCPVLSFSFFLAAKPATLRSSWPSLLQILTFLILRLYPSSLLRAFLPLSFLDLFFWIALSVFLLVNLFLFSGCDATEIWVAWSGMTATILFFFHFLVSFLLLTASANTQFRTEYLGRYCVLPH